MHTPSWRPKLVPISLFLAVLLIVPAIAQAQELVHFPSNDADLTNGAPTQIDAYLFRPSGAGPFPAVVGMHGCGGLLNHKGEIVRRETEWAQTLTAHGYVVLYPESFVSRHYRSDCIAAAPPVEPWRERPRDAYGALFYLQSLPFVIPERVGLMGWSHGGGTVVFTVGTAAAGRPPTLPKGDFRAAVAFYPGWCDAKNLGPDWTTAIPLLWLNGAADDWVPAEPCHAVMDRAVQLGAHVEMKLYAGAYHDFDWPGEAVHTIGLSRKPPKIVHAGFDQAAHDDAVARVTAFFDAHLKP